MMSVQQASRKWPLRRTLVPAGTDPPVQYRGTVRLYQQQTETELSRDCRIPIAVSTQHSAAAGKEAFETAQTGAVKFI